MGISDIIHYKSDNEQIQAVDVKDGLIYAACGTAGIKIFDMNLKLLLHYREKKKPLNYFKDFFLFSFVPILQ